MCHSLLEKAQINWSVPRNISDSCSNIFFLACQKLNLTQMVNEATRGFNTLEIILTTHPKHISSLSISPPFTDTCDHKSLTFTLVAEYIPSSSIRVHSPNFFKADYQAITNYLGSIDWHEVFQLSQSTQGFWDFIRSTLNHIINDRKFMPLKSNRRLFRYPRVIRRLLLKKRKLYRRIHLDSKHKLSYIMACRDYKIAVNSFRKQYEANIIYSKNPKLFYSFMKRKLQMETAIPPIYDENENLAADNDIKANIFNNFFASVFVEDDHTIPCFQSDITSEGLNQVVFPLDSIAKKLHQLPAKFTYSPDGFSPIFLKNLANALAIPFQLLFESSFLTGSIPSDWKISVILPIHKRGNRSQVSNYRPVALTSIICKVMESMIVDVLSLYLRSNSLLVDSQHGFSKMRSPCTQLLQALNQWTSEVDSNNQIDVIHIDFCRAFDTVCIRKLIIKLKHFEIDFDLLKWISEFISDRSQRVLIGESLSTTLPITSGIPQGSVIGPVLFNIYINDIVNIARGSCNLGIFADDVKIFQQSTDGNFLELTESLHELSLWSNIWQLAPSPNKCKSITFGRNIIDQTYHLNGSLIQKVSNVRDLGIIFTHDLKFSLHCQTISSKAISRAYLVLKCFTLTDPKILMKAYFTYVRPIIEYCTQIWNPYLVKDIKCVEKVQKYFTKQVCRRGHFNCEDYRARLRIFGLQSLEYRRIFFDLVFVFKLINKLVDIPYEDFFVMTESITRGHSLKLKPVDRHHCNIRNYFFTHRIIGVWNSLPDYIISSHSLHSFKSRLRTFDLSPFCKVFV